MVSAEMYMFVSAILISLGVYGLIAKRNFIRLLISIEVILNGVNLNLVAFNTYRAYFFPGGLDLGGHLIALFTIGIAASEAAIGLALAVSVYRAYRTINVDRLRELRG